MAALGTLVMGKVLGKSSAESAFRPWWDKMSDYILYGMATVSVILIPTAMFNTLPMDCNLCQPGRGVCLKQAGNQTFKQDEQGLQKDPGYNMWWAKKYCLMNEIDWFVLHLPYILMMFTVFLYSIEKFTVRGTKGNVIQDKFYALLIDYHILEPKKDEDTSGSEKLVAGDELETRRDLVDLRDRLQGSSSYFYSYLLTQVLEFVFSGFCAALTAFKASTAKGLGVDATVFCNIHGFQFECSGHPSAFYTGVNLLACSLFSLYALISLCSIVWVSCPCLHSLERLSILQETKEVGSLQNSRDFRFLLNLLGLGEGIAPAISAMAHLDRRFHEEVKAQKFLKVETPPASRVTSMQLRDNVDFTFSLENQSVSLTVELEEPTEGVLASLASLSKVSYIGEVKLAQEDPDNKATTDVQLLVPARERRASFLESLGRSKRASSTGTTGRKATFRDLRRGADYTLTVKTLLDGQTVATRKEKFNTSDIKALEQKLVATRTNPDAAKPSASEHPTPPNTPTPAQGEEVKTAAPSKGEEVKPHIPIEEIQRASVRMKQKNSVLVNMDGEEGAGVGAEVAEGKEVDLLL